MAAAPLGGGRRATVVRVRPDGSARNRYASTLCSVETTKPAAPIAASGPATANANTPVPTAAMTITPQRSGSRSGSLLLDLTSPAYP